MLKVFLVLGIILCFAASVKTFMLLEKYLSSDRSKAEKAGVALGAILRMVTLMIAAVILFHVLFLGGFAL